MKLPGRPDRAGGGAGGGAGGAAGRAAVAAERPAPPSPTSERGRGGDLSRLGMRLLVPALWRTRVSGAEHLPASGPVLLAANHSGLLDGPLVWTLLRRDARFLVKGSMFTGFLGTLLHATRQIPLEPGQEARALMLAGRVLAAGRVVGIFPEGTRGSGEVDSVRSGVAWLALRSGAPVVPVAVLGTAASRRGPKGLRSLPPLRGTLRVVLAPPIHLDAHPELPRREALALATEQVRVVLATHVATALTGAPAPTGAPTGHPTGTGAPDQTDPPPRPAAAPQHPSTGDQA